MESVELLRILDELTKITGHLLELKKPTAGTTPSRSVELKELFTALAKAQMDIEVAGLHNENPFFKSRYADLATVVRASRPHLTKNGLSVIQQIMPNDDGQLILHTILAHSSGQWIETRMRVIPAKNDVQTLGSTLTYLRRYSYAALVGVVAGTDDDDGEVAVAHYRDTQSKGVGISVKYDPRQQSADTITSEQLEELEYELAEYPDIAETILDKLQLQSLADMPKNKFMVSVQRVREIKALRNNGTPIR
jgi:hypothetical protein